MRIHALIPVRGLGDGKSRLSPPLTGDDRAALIVDMLRHVIGAVQKAGVIEQIIVVSPDANILTLAVSLGATPLPQQSTGLNPALDEARAAALQDGAEAALVLHADLPRLTPAEIAAMIAQLPGASAAVIAPDHSGSGTNALLLAPPGALPFHFGHESFARHRDAAEASGLPFTIFHAPGIAGDIDTPADLPALAAAHREEG